MNPLLLDDSRRDGRTLAMGHRIGPSGLTARAVKRRLRVLDREFSAYFKRLRESPAGKVHPGLTAGGRDWLLENDFIVAEALESLDGALTAPFLARLPGLQSGEEVAAAVRQPRVEAVAREIVRGERGRVEEEEIFDFVEGYQELHPLRLAELWALPSFLSLTLLEELLRELASAEDRVEVGPYILSLRALAAQDWRDLVESLSQVERILRDDPAGVHPRMDFRTRDRYRRQVEEIAWKSGRGEDVVAARAIELARSRKGEPREGHIGYYLVDEGRGELFRALQGRVPTRGTPSRKRRWAGVAYFGGIGLFSFLFLLGFHLVTEVSGLPALLLLIFVTIPSVGAAVALANRVAGRVVSPRPLPRLDFRGGIDPRFRTVVAVPSLLGSRREVRDLLETLESNYQANSDPALSFALVSDFPDADTERTRRDAVVLSAAAEGIRTLNARYGEGGAGPFLLLHRSRRWNPSEGRWMGWERKRGKLAELNDLLLGQPSGLWVVEGERQRLEGAPFVLTLDADTRMPRGAAARLVGTLAHPLNRPELGAGGRVLRGYSVLQPRIEILPDPDGGTVFSRVYGEVQGLDLYAHAAFDVYQDLFDVGIFAGKGLYDVRAFEASLAGRTPENTILSHDLFEGAHGRAGLVSDLILLEEFPGHPLAHARRAHRWARGDWQILPWIFPKVPAERGRRLRNRLSLLSRWMIVDNLRRSLQPPAVLLALLLGWIAMPAQAAAWTLVLVGVMGIPFFTGTLDAALRAAGSLPRRSDLEAEARAASRGVGRWALELAFLPFEAWNALDAVARSLHRMFHSRKHLLEWTSAAVTTRAVSRGESIGFFIRNMPGGPLTAAGASAVLLTLHGAVPSIAAPILFLWFVSPAVGQFVRRPRRLMREPRGEFPRERARTLARRIWGYYERFQGPEEHWLAPDHFQEDPGAEVAYRTSPTNLGMAMVASVTAWDLGFHGTPAFVARVRAMVDGMSGLPRFRGHFLNWYDTVSRAPLHPIYVSTVDSGNLAASFLVVRESLKVARWREPWNRERPLGILDTVRVIRELLQAIEQGASRDALLAGIRELEGKVESRLGEAWEAGLPAFVQALEEVRDQDLPPLEAHLIQAGLGAPPAGTPGQWEAIHAWFAHLRADIDHAHDEILLLLPWLRSEFRDRAAAAALHDRLLPEGVRIPSLPRLETFLDREASTPAKGVLPDGLQEELAQAHRAVRFLLDELDGLEDELDALFREMDFSFLYDRFRRLLRIGYSVSLGELDPNHYDLLASEARIASLIAVSKGDVPPAHWLHLGRPFAWTPRGPVLLSWAGTMFEYLMPSLFLRTPPETVLGEACWRAVEVQQDFGKKSGIPWGISESGYHVLSQEGHYQYHAFGVPALGLRRKTDRRLVVAPYASLMAVAIAPGAVARNLDALTALNGIGPWGPYEALDFGPDGQWKGEPRVVKSYMSHHHGMILAALGNHLTDRRLVERFHRDPRIRTAEPLLHERIPWRRSVERKWVDRSAPVQIGGAGPGIRRWSPSMDRDPPPLHLLHSGNLVVGIGPDGRGGSRWKDWAILRGWVGTGAEARGPDLALLDLDTNESWRPLSETGSPSSDDTRIHFEPHRAEFTRRSRDLRVRMEVFLAPENGVEVRQLSLSNESDRPRRLRMALWTEVALAPFQGDLRHPAFHKLFVRAEALPDGQGLFFQRRSARSDEVPPVLLVSVLGGEGPLPRMRWSTSRERFLGRGGDPSRPAAFDNPGLPVPPREPHHPLDPVAAAVMDVDLPPWGDLSLTVLFAVAEDQASAVRHAAELRSEGRREWARIQSRARAEGELLRLGAQADGPMVWEELLSHVLHPQGILRSAASLNDLRQSSLWRWGISGDLPFILVEGGEETESGILAELVKAQQWWARRGQKVDIVLLDRGAGEYQDQVRDRVRGHLAHSGGEDMLGRPGGVHIVKGEGANGEEWVGLHSLAAFRVDLGGGSLEEQVRVARRVPAPILAPPISRPIPGVRGPLGSDASPPPEPVALVAPSAFGGFDPESGEYVIDLKPGAETPAPWVNIVSRDEIGFVVSESGGSFTWLGDAGEFRLTPWSNDPLLGLRGEALYLRDEANGRVWTPTPGPLGLRRHHRIRHGWGRTTLEAADSELDEEVTWSLHPTLPAKLVRVRLTNRSDAPRRLSATFFVEWVLGTHPMNVAGRLSTWSDEAQSAVLARNPFSIPFSGKVAFLASYAPASGLSTDRGAFLGSEGPFDRIPIGLSRLVRGERIEARGSRCGVIRRDVTLAPGEERELVFFLGGVGAADAVADVLAGLRSSPEGEDLAAKEAARWKGYLGRIRVRTPEPALDCLMNGWLPYQTIASRMRGRTGFYQSGGAFGFRDQLQDAYALLPLDPSLAEAQLEAAAARQFRAGDVLHWWHPQTTRGVQTRCSDDLLWLPWVLAQTVRWTGDRSLLDRRVPYLAGEPLPDGVDERYEAFAVSEEDGSLWEHALRAVERTGSMLSPRGLPLIGTGDWNDGMDRVGDEGRGESIWLGWFFLDVCRFMIPLARARSDEEAALKMEGWSDTVHRAIESHGWDGEWYRRAFFDDGSPIGSRESVEARIDSIAQSWGVISRAADPGRARQAVDSAWRELVRADDGIALLLTPPFTGEGPNPGYIAAYPPGVRENGGQYTHSAAWLIRALALQGDGVRAGELLALLLPTRHAAGEEGTERYRVEPYVLAADVYGTAPYVGRGGWTWYTGSAGWLWRVALEDVLGISREGGFLRVNPCIPPAWDGFEVEIEVEGVRVEVRVRNPEGRATGIHSCAVDGLAVDPARIPIGSGEGRIRVEVVMGE